MDANQGAVVGRERELAAIEAFLSAPHGGVTALLIEGEAGIGKTTLWNAGVRAARDDGRDVLWASPAEQESKLAFSTLDDLLGGPFDEVADHLAPPLRAALEVALLRVESRGLNPDRRAVGVAVNEVLQHLAARGRLLLVIDDLQWMDVASAQALAFAIRRMGDAPLGVLAALRIAPGLSDPLDLDRAVPKDGLRHLHVGPLDAPTLQRVLSRRSDASISPTLARRLHEASRGNPFFAGELARSLEREGSEPRTGEPFPVPHDLARLLRSHAGLVSDRTRDLLLLVAASGRPSLELVQQLMGSAEATTAALEEARHHALIETFGDRIRFVHPLLGSSVYADAGPEGRRAAHGRIAGVVDDPIERAWHLGLAAAGADEGVATALDGAAEIAEARGAPAIASQFSELATRLTPPGDAEVILVRSIASAERLFEAGDVTGATARLEGIAANAPRGAMKAEALHRLCHLAWNDVRRVRELATAALAEIDEDGPPILLANLHRAMGWVELWGGDARLAGPHLDRSLALAESSGDQVELALSLNGQAYLAFFMGRPDAMELVHRAMALEEEPRTIDLLLTHPRRTLGQLQLWAGDLDRAREELERDYREVLGRGHLGLLWENLEILCELEVRAGNWDQAARYADEGLDAVTDVLLEQAREVLLWSSAMVAAHRGEVEVARAHATEGLRLAERHEDRWYVLANGSVLGFLELSLGNPAGAHGHLAPLVRLADQMGLREPGIFPFLSDEIEALVALGELEEAETLLAHLDDLGGARDRPLALAQAARCRALLGAARNDMDGAASAIAEAIEHHSRVPQPFDRARSLLVLGQIQRRRKQKRAARDALEHALAAFDQLCAPLWAAKARAELARIGGRAPSTTELTPTERQVADLVAGGMTNREAAAALFMSEHTVRANLKRVYAKLGVRSRTELAALARGEVGPAPED